MGLQRYRAGQLLLARQRLQMELQLFGFSQLAASSHQGPEFQSRKCHILPTT